jgi:hypothetical protein
MPVERLTIDDMSDREFLLVLHDQRDSDGWTDSEQIRQQLDLAERRIASTRLSWLARWGAVEREVKLDTDGEPVYTRHGKLRYTQRWCLTPAGSALAFGSLKARQQQTLDSVDDTQLLETMTWLTTRVRAGSDTARKLISREWRYGTSASRNGHGR